MGLTRALGPGPVMVISMNVALKGAVRTLLTALGFGAAMGLCFNAAWLLLDRALTGDTLIATFYLTAAGTISAGLALTLVARLHRRPWTSRFAAAFVILAAGTGALTAFFIMTQTVTASHDLTEMPVRVALLVMSLSTATALYNFLTMAGLAVLPFALPLIVAFAYLIAHDAR